jgi:hypothetical protein
MKTLIALGVLLLLGMTRVCIADVSQEWENTLAPKGQPAPPLALASAGTTDYVILIAADATTQDQKAAGDLARFLKEMSGAEFAIVREGEAIAPPKFISVGRTEVLDKADIPDASADLDVDGYAIAQVGDNLFLLGGTLRGPINAVYAMLEEDLGCRWYDGEVSVIPRTDDLTVRIVPRRYVPALKYRDPWYFDTFNTVPDWCLANRVNGQMSNILGVWGGHMNYPPGYHTHTFQLFVPRSEYFEKHPEFFALIDGARSPRHLCLTNPTVLRISIVHIRKLLTERGGGDEMVDVSHYDGSGHCECENCAAIDNANGGTAAGSLLAFVNKVAEELEDEFPNTRFSTLAYLDTIQAPTQIRPRKNVVIQLCNNLHSWNWPLADFTVDQSEELTRRWIKAIEEWSKIADQIHIWDYTSNLSHYLAPMPNMHLIAPSIRFYVDHNVKGVMFQGSYQSPGERSKMRCWVMAKLLWDPSLDTDALIRDFNHGYYGKAAAPMQAYDELLDEAGKPHRHLVDLRYRMDAPFLTKEFIAKADALFAEAEALAADDPKLLERVEMNKLPILYVKCERGRELCGDDYPAIIDEFERIAKTHKVRYLSEVEPPDTEKRIEFWRGMSEANPREVSFQELPNEWLFKPDPDEIGQRDEWYSPQLDDSEWASVRSDTGNGWERQGFPGYLGYGWYRLRIAGPFDTRGPVFQMLFTAVDEEAEIWINGQKAFDHTIKSTGLGQHVIWDTPFAFDPSPWLRSGSDNLIAVRVFNGMGMGGIIKPVYYTWCDRETPGPVLSAIIESQRKQSSD